MTSETPSNYIFTKSKGKFYFNNPTTYFSKLPHSEFAREVAYALSNLCRFNGHCDQYYSVLHHTLLGYMTLVDLRSTIISSFKDSLQLSGQEATVLVHYAIVLWLLHDASEAYLGDIPSPLKVLLPEYSKLETEVQESIHTTYFFTRLGLNCSGSHFAAALELVKKVDMAMLCAEKKLIVSDMEEWPGLNNFLKYDLNREIANQALYNLKGWISSKEKSIYPTSLNGRFKSSDESGNVDTLYHLLNIVNYPRSASGNLPNLL